jgi:hypothetical protein
MKKQRLRRHAYRFYCQEGCPEGKDMNTGFAGVARESSVRERGSPAEAPVPSARAENPPLEE